VRAEPIGAFPVAADVGREEDIEHLVAATIERFGADRPVRLERRDRDRRRHRDHNEQWRRIIDISLMSEVWAARHAVPHMLEQGSGYLLNVARPPACG